MHKESKPWTEWLTGVQNNSIDHNWALRVSFELAFEGSEENTLVEETLFEIGMAPMET